MLIAVGVINYQLSKQSALTVSKGFEASWTSSTR